VTSAITPLRASDVHDSKVRRIATITPDMFAPNRTTLRPAITPAVRESNDNIPNRSRRVRVQTVNANPYAKKCGIKLYRRDSYENISALYSN
jgi:hypothetical protein